MNILAHLYLSFEDPHLMIGNFIGDHVRNRDLVHFHPQIQKGVQLHWAIDAFTDSHNIVHQSKERLRPTYKKYSAVLVDLFYDHFLSKNWEQYHHQPLDAFAQAFYFLMDQHHHNMPASVQHMMPYMKRYNWLVGYGHFEGMQQVLNGMSRRAKFQSNMEKSLHDLQHSYTDFEQEFADFFPELIGFVNDWLGEDLGRR
jgi:acyl carrier protein phosphodiesterase